MSICDILYRKKPSIRRPNTLIMTQKKHHYTKDNLTVYWEPEKCIHSGICARGLPQVFKPKERPWVQTDGATAQQIAAQVDQCPSSAISYEWNDTSTAAPSHTSTATKINILEDGPMIIKGPLEIDYQGETIKVEEGKQAALCRCGASTNKPLCDGSHKKAGFKDR